MGSVRRLAPINRLATWPLTWLAAWRMRRGGAWPLTWLTAWRMGRGRSLAADWLAAWPLGRLAAWSLGRLAERQPGHRDRLRHGVDRAGGTCRRCRLRHFCAHRVD